MGSLTVRVTPRSARPGVSVEGHEVAVRVKAPPAEGRPTEEARRALAAALGVPTSRVALRSGARSRRKAFEIQGLTTEQAMRALSSR